MPDITVTQTPIRIAPDTNAQPMASDVEGQVQQQPPAQIQEQTDDAANTGTEGVSQANNSFDAQPDPHFSAAKKLHDIAYIMAGQPTTSTVDADGKMVREKKPMTGKELGLALAFSALSGALGGLGAKGPNHAAQAASAGFNIGQKQVQQRDAQQDATAQNDYERHANIMEQNMRAYNNAIHLAGQSYDMHKKIADNNGDLVKSLQDAPEGTVVEHGVKESDLPKYHVTKDLAIPDGVVESDNKGGQGETQYENTYTILNPDAKITLPDSLVKRAQEAGLPGFVKSDGKPIQLPANAQARALLAVKVSHDLATIDLGEQTMKDWQDRVDRDLGKKDKKGNPIPGSAPKLPSFSESVRQDPGLLTAFSKMQSLMGDPLTALNEARKPEHKIDGNSVSRISKLLGGTDLVNQMNEAEKTRLAGEEAKARAAETAPIKIDIHNQEANSDEARLKTEGSVSHVLGKDINTVPTATKDNYGDSFEDVVARMRNMGVNIPSQLQLIYNDAHLKGDFGKDFPNRVNPKSGQMDLQTAKTIAAKFINPDIDYRDYKAGQILRDQFADHSPGKPGWIVNSANTVIEHMKQLHDAGVALNNGDLTALNKIAKFYNLQTGQSPNLVFDAIAHQVNNEIGKITSGGKPTIEELNGLESKLNSTLSAKDAIDVGNTYAGMMVSRLRNLNEDWKTMFGENNHGILKAHSRQLLDQMGIDSSAIPRPWSRSAFKSKHPDAPTADIDGVAKQAKEKGFDVVD